MQGTEDAGKETAGLSAWDESESGGQSAGAVEAAEWGGGEGGRGQWLEKSRDPPPHLALALLRATRFLVEGVTLPETSSPWRGDARSFPLVPK